MVLIPPCGVLEILEQTSIEDNIMKTFIDEYIEQGRKKGKKEGRQQAGYKILSTQLTHRFDNLPKWASPTSTAAQLATKLNRSCTLRP